MQQAAEKSLKCLAREAKNRFKRGFWTEFLLAKQSILESEEDEKIKEIKIKALYYQTRKKLDSDYMEEDEESTFYNKVSEMLSSGALILNPIQRLVDEEYIKTLTEEEKQNYIIRLGDRYRKAKERFEKEQELLNASS
ncbi:MAG: hypothetical protein FWD89_05220 [Firmicutes bacterium]|nr:hypothetical protein [Bacillota bacterium]